MAARGGIHVVLLALVACLDDSPAGPRAQPVQLQISAQVASGENDWAIGVRVYYFRNSEQSVDLPVAPAVIRLARAETVTQPLAVDIAPCLQDPDRFIGESAPGACELRVELQLFDEDGQVLSERSNLAVASAPGEVVEVAPFTLPVGELYATGPPADFSAFFDERPPQTLFYEILSTGSHDPGPLTTRVEYVGTSQGWLRANIDVEGILHVQPTTTLLPSGTHYASVFIESTRGFTPAEILVSYTVDLGTALAAAHSPIVTLASFGSFRPRPMEGP